MTKDRKKIWRRYMGKKRIPPHNAYHFVRQGNFTACLLTTTCGLEGRAVFYGLAKRDPGADADDQDRGCDIAFSRAVQDAAGILPTLHL